MYGDVALAQEGQIDNLRLDPMGSYKGLDLARLWNVGISMLLAQACTLLCATALTIPYWLSVFTISALLYAPAQKSWVWNW